MGIFAMVTDDVLLDLAFRVRRLEMAESLGGRLAVLQCPLNSYLLPSDRPMSLRHDLAYSFSRTLSE